MLSTDFGEKLSTKKGETREKMDLEEVVEKGRVMLNIAQLKDEQKLIIVALLVAMMYWLVLQPNLENLTALLYCLTFMTASGERKNHHPLSSVLCLCIYS